MGHRSRRETARRVRAWPAKEKAILVINREGARGIDIKPEDSAFVYTDGERTGGGLSVTSTARSARIRPLRPAGADPCGP